MILFNSNNLDASNNIQPHIGTYLERPKIRIT